MELAARIANRTARVVVVGGGYVGLPLANALVLTGFPTTVYDTDAGKVAAINLHESYIPDVTVPFALQASTSAAVLAPADVIVICVPTPLNKTKDPDNSFILTAVDALLNMNGRTPRLVILESTTFPGFTREVLLPKLAARGKLDEDFFLAFSPERVDPGNKTFGIRNTPKIVGGVSPLSTDLALEFYGAFVDTVVRVSSSDAAEMTKLLENTYRAVNIGLANEIAIMCGHLGLDTREIIAAAASKPFGFQAFQPGPGVGGHCIGLDPLYLSWKLKTLKYDARFVALADEVNSAMPAHVVELATRALNDRSKAVRGAKILIYGVAYKRDVRDTRESPALDIIELLRQRGAEVSYYDTHVPWLGIDGVLPEIMPYSTGYDLGVVVTDHSDVDYTRLALPLIVDTRGVVPPGPNVIRL